VKGGDGPRTPEVQHYYNQAFEELGIYQTLYGHQELCMGMDMTLDRKYLISCDQLKKLTVTNFPNVFNLQSVLLEHTNAIAHICPFGKDLVASVAENDNGTQRIIVSSVVDASVKSDTAFKTEERGTITGLGRCKDS